jgi:DNA repair ATPase RecN
VLTHIEIENFQSLRQVSIGLGRFTVVTGATGSGKSAVIRAARHLAFNARGTGYITRGAKSCKVTVGGQDGDGWAVRLERGAGRGKDCYRLHRGPVLRENPGEVFAKLAGGVPEQVTDALQLSELNFAAQFDRPFLLDSSGGEAARVLGKLTNVTLLFEAARECSRRRLEVMGDLKRAEAELARLTEEAQRFRGMRGRQEAVSEAEEALERVQDTEARLGRLRALTARLEAAEAALERAAPPQVPDGSRLEELAGRLDRARSLYAQLDGAVLAMEGARFAVSEAGAAERAAHERLHQVLAEAGQCPTCGQDVA